MTLRALLSLVLLHLSLQLWLCVATTNSNNNITWPATHVVPDTPGWRSLHMDRWHLVEQIPDYEERLHAHVITVNSALLVPNFTEHGWGLTRVPNAMLDRLVQTLHYESNAQLSLSPDQRTYEDAEMCHNMGLWFDDATPPIFMRTHSMNWDILHQLLPLHEQWSGVELEPVTAYGLRVYQNNTELHMHIDNPNTHVISSILHIDHSADSEPWPLVLEDFQGNTHQVLLQPGDLLFYESCKVLHGRPRRFQGSYYSSLFIHYHPKDWDWETTLVRAEQTGEEIVPLQPTIPQTDAERQQRYAMFGMGILQPDCPDNWCNLQTAIEWKGPAKEGVVMTTGYEVESHQDEL